MPSRQTQCFSDTHGRFGAPSHFVPKRKTRPTGSTRHNTGQRSGGLRRQKHFDELSEDDRQFFCNLLGLDDAPPPQRREPRTRRATCTQAIDSASALNQEPCATRSFKGVLLEREDTAKQTWGGKRRSSRQRKIAQQTTEGKNPEGREIEKHEEPLDFRPNRSRQAKKAQRPSQPGSILDSIQNEARDFFYTAPPGRTDLSYNRPRRRKPGGLSRQSPSSRLQSHYTRKEEPTSLYTILSRRLRIITATTSADSFAEFDSRELAFLESKNYSAESIDFWISCLLEQRSISAARMFRAGDHVPPFFLVLLFLRRKHIKSRALGVVMGHVQAKLQQKTVGWISLQMLFVRLLRHARRAWPEAIPWIASLFTTEATRVYDQANKETAIPPAFLSDLTSFSNLMLSLVSLPVTEHPIVDARHQEKAEFQILQFMANCNPALVVNRTGFRATARTQLTHGKTAQERGWADLKGPSWPPWKEAKTAMDEEKGYDFGISRASRILHRMHEAGYEPRKFEQVIELYAGWDTDRSPTIQTRTSLPRISTHYSNRSRLHALLWFARIQTTRTRREAWACFLAHEASHSPAYPDAYLAMFEKLYYPEIEDHPEIEEQDLEEEYEPSSPKASHRQHLLPGDMKEVLPDPSSPLHLVHIHEPVPTYEQLVHRMMTHRVRPSMRLLAFLIETLPDHGTCMELLKACEGAFHDGIRHLLQGTILEGDNKSLVPDYFLGSFFRFLCRFGRYAQPPTTIYSAVPLENHQSLMETDQSYLLEYACTLLVRCRIAYRPLWTTYMQKVLYRGIGRRRTGHPVDQYRVICQLLDMMGELDLDPDDHQFHLFCQAAQHAAEAVFKGAQSSEDRIYILSSVPHRLRTMFHTLVSANVDSATLVFGTDKKPLSSPHIPTPVLLHAYVRALAALRDYEGLYSFSTWATTYHEEVTSRAQAQNGGWRAWHKTLVVLRAALEGNLGDGGNGAPRELTELVKAQIDGVDEWGWPNDKHIETYTIGSWSRRFTQESGQW